jgi:hypothetical protein
VTNTTDGRQPFPSPRQSRCPGLQPRLYPSYLRDLVDVDYAAQLSDAERIWLAAFLEEHYRGYRLANETQLHPLDKLRESDAARKRVLRSEDVLAFEQHRAGSLDEASEVRGGCEDAALQLLAGSQSRNPHELRSKNFVEDDLIKSIDRASSYLPKVFCKT